MNPIIPPLTPGESGPQIANLQDGLQALLDRESIKTFDPPDRPTIEELQKLAETLKSEREQALFGDATLFLTVYFQLQQGLGSSLRGVVEDTTAARLNELLKALGVPLAADKYVVRGSVVDAGKLPLPGLVVVAYDRDLRRHQELGRAETDAKGMFEIPYRYESYRQAEGIVQPELDLILQVARRLDHDALEFIHVHEEPRPVPPVATVNLVLPAPTDVQLSEFEKGSTLIPPLFVGQGPEIRQTFAAVGVQPSRYANLQASDVTEDDVPFIVRETALDAALVRAWAESARLLQQAQALLPEDAVLEDRQALEANGWPFFFGWRRAGLAAGLSGVLHSEATRWATSLRIAHERGRTPAISEAAAKALLQALARLQTIARLDPRYAADPLFAAVGAVPIDLPGGVMGQALDRFKARGLAALSEFDALAEGNPELRPGLAELAKTLRVYSLIDGDTSLLQPLVKQLRVDSEGLAPLAALGSDQWLKLVKAAGLDGAAAEHKSLTLQIKMEQLLPTEALQARVSGGELAFAGQNPVGLSLLLESRRGAVDTLLRGGETDDSNAFRQEHPGLADEIGNLGRWVKGGAGFVVGKELIDMGAKSPGWLTNFGPTAIEVIMPTVKLGIRDLMVSQQERFHRSIDTLINTQIDSPKLTLTTPTQPMYYGSVRPSAAQLPGMSSPTLRGMFGDLDECVCRPCESVLGQGAYLVDLLNLLKREVRWRGPSGGVFQTGLDLLRTRRPDLLDLELNCDNAEIPLPHIDLALEAMEWLALGNQLEFQAALARPIVDWFRPALLLALIQQTTGEAINSLQASPDSADLRRWRVTDGLRVWMFEVARDSMNSSVAMSIRLVGRSIRRTEASPDPRIAPAHPIPAAYTALSASTAVYPWSLPFDLAAAESRQFVERMKLPRPRLLELTSPFNITAWVNEILGLTEAERLLLENQRAGDLLWQAWGFENASPITEIDPASGEVLASQTPQQLLQRASILLARTELTLAELEAALATRFVGGFTLTARDQCKTSLMRVALAASPEALDRLHRLVRLWRKLPGWTLDDVDAALTALNALPTPTVRVIDSDVLAGFAHLQEARRVLGLPLETLLGLREPLSAVSVAQGAGGQSISLFASVFLSNRVGAAARDLFARVAEPGRESTEKISDHLGPLAAALGLEASSVLSLVDVVGGDAITHASLTALFRHITLARAIGAVPTHIQLLIELTGIKPLGEATPAAAATSAERAKGFASLVTFAKAAAKFKDGGISPVLAADVMLPTGDALRESIVRPVEIKPDDQITNEIKALRESLRKARPDAKVETAALKIQTLEALSLVMDSATARLVLDAILDPQTRPDPKLVEALSGAAITVRDPFGIGLLRSAEASYLLATYPEPQTPEERLASERKRLAGVVDAAGEYVLNAAGEIVQRGVLVPAGEYAQRLLLVETVGRWTGLSGAMLMSVLQDRLKVDAAAGGVPRQAWKAFLDKSFWSATDTAAVASELIIWAKRLDRLMATLKGMDASLALTVLKEQEWASLILPAVGTSAASRWETLQSVLDLRWLAQPTQLSEGVLREHVAALDASGAAANLPLAATPLARRLGVEPAEALAMIELVTQSEATLDSLRSPKVMRQLTELSAMAKPWRATASQMAALAGTVPVQLSQTARQLLAAHDGAEAWPATLTGISNALRKLQRDALTAYLQRASAGTRDANQLYEQLLIDPQVQPCLMTTRITQAVASVQMFVQRILFGLEPDVIASEVLLDRWSWMRSYRLWEANRKVFLYPQNWLFPELRDDKSSGFRRLEATLSQGELTHERAGQAFGQFLAEVNEVAQTQVLGLFEDTDARTRRDLYIIGRTPNPPYIYHWRICRDFGKRWMEWSPWERIELDIQGDHVMPFMVNGRLHVAWPIIQKHAAEKQADAAAQTPDKWQIEMAWSHFDGLAWRKVSSSRDDAPKNDAPKIEQRPFEDERSTFAFRSQTSLAGTPPVIHAYAKVPLSAARGTPETTPELVRGGVSKPQRLSSFWGVGELSKLLLGVYSDLSLSEQLRDLFQFYCVITYIQPQPPDGKPGSSLRHRDIQVDGKINEIFQDHTNGDWPHLGWHLKVRSDPFTGPIVAAFSQEPSASNNPPSLKYHVVSKINEFVLSMRQHSDDTEYQTRAHAILDRCSSRQVRFRVWAIPRAGSNQRFELLTTDGTFSLKLKIDGVDSTSPSLAPGVLSEPLLKAGGSSGDDAATLKWTPQGNEPLSSTTSESLASVAVGCSVIQTLHFEIIDADMQTRPRLAALLDLPRPFRQMQRFVLQATGTMATQDGDNTATLDTISNSDVWMNGLQENKGSNQSYGLALREGNGLDRLVFGSSAAGSRYWIVGAAAPDATALQQTSIWHFKEGTASCYLDLNPEPAGASSPSGISLYPSGWHRGDKLTRAWYETGSLPSGAAQNDNFGAAALPSLSAATRQWLPREVSLGERAFDHRLPNACYNWEIYFHAPILIADHLSKQQRFEDAERWLRMVFDPQNVEPGVPDSFLRFRVFREMPRGLSVGNDLKALARAAASESTSPPVDAIKDVIAKWRSQPYRPFVIARRRQVAFLWRTVFTYLDNLLAWADSLYRRDTRETIAEAAQLYVLAARILGSRPRIASAHRRQASSYADLAQKWDDFANAWFDAATPGQTPPSGSPAPADKSGTSATPAPEGFLFFCIPVNDKLSTYWNLVEERLFNIRHCRNIEGIARDLPLTAPAIDVELLVRATAAGLDIADVVNGLFARPLPYRYSVVVARALDLAGDVRAFGSALLSAMEKRDAEKLAQLRSTNEIDLLKRMSEVRKLQIEEAERNIDALRASRAGTAARFEQLQRQLGNTEVRAPGEQETRGQESSLGRLAGGTAVQTSKWGLIVEEQRQLEHQGIASWWSDADSVAHIVSAVLSLSASVGETIPPVKLAGVPDALRALASASETTAQSFRAISTIHQTEASRQATSAGHIRRRDEWAHQSNQALRELRQIDKQILANEIRIALTKLEARNHETQIEQAEAINLYLKEKFTNTELYEWMASELSNLHSAAYRMTLDMARQAERASARELGLSAINLIRNDYWNSQRSRLLAGDRLHQDLKRLEVAHMEKNRREHEVTKHISLRMLNPTALLDLKSKGTCDFDVPEWLFDMDVPGHYMRRIKTVSLSIPCVVGPYSSINAKLTLLRSDVRHSPSADGTYRQNTNDDSRFITRFGATESIVTSNGRDDSGLFETNLRDERYLPFENEGAISRWRIEISQELAQFDHETISDAVLHMRYTARDRGASLASVASTSLKNALQGTDLANEPWKVMIGLKSEFRAQWAQWEQTAVNARSPITVKLSSELLPYWMRAASMKIKELTLEWIALQKADGVQTTADPPKSAALGADGTVTINGVPDSSVEVLLIFKVQR